MTIRDLFKSLEAHNKFCNGFGLDTECQFYIEYETNGYHALVCWRPEDNYFYSWQDFSKYSKMEWSAPFYQELMKAEFSFNHEYIRQGLIFAEARMKFCDTTYRIVVNCVKFQ
jgi:hypothetical protein